MSGSYRAEQVLADPSRFGFVTARELGEIAAEEPFRRVLVRCSCGRFVTGARLRLSSRLSTKTGFNTSVT